MAKGARRTVVTDAATEALLKRLQKVYQAKSETAVTLADAVRIAIKDAGRLRGLLPSAPSTVEPIGGGL